MSDEEAPRSDGDHDEMVTVPASVTSCFIDRIRCGVCGEPVRGGSKSTLQTNAERHYVETGHAEFEHIHRLVITDSST